MRSTLFSIYFLSFLYIPILIFLLLIKFHFFTFSPSTELSRLTSSLSSFPYYSLTWLLLLLPCIFFSSSSLFLYFILFVLLLFHSVGFCFTAFFKNYCFIFLFLRLVFESSDESPVAFCWNILFLSFFTLLLFLCLSSFYYFLRLDLFCEFE